MNDSLPIEPVLGPIDATVTVPGSKSITNRALVVAALANGESVLRRPLVADDTSAMLACIRALGATVDTSDPGAWRVTGTNGAVVDGPVELFTNQSGTTARFVAPLTALGRGDYTIDGHPQMQARPMGSLAAALRGLGLAVDLVDDDFLPMQVRVGATTARQVSLPADVSSQFASGLLLVAPCLPDGLDIELTTAVVSRPYIDLTVEVMRAFGASVVREGSRYLVASGGYRSTDYGIEPDASAASYFFGAAAVVGGRVRVEGLGARSLQGDVGFVDLLDRMGATVVRESDATEVIVSEPLHGIDVDMRDISDTVPTMAVVAASASSPSRIRGVGFIREKESDRIGAVVNELRRLGIDAVEEPDGLVVRPGAISPGVVETYDDHRIAMSFALLGLLAPGIVISHPGCVGKTFPGFFSALERIRSNPAMSTPEDDLDDFAGELPVDEPGDMVAAAVIAIDGPAGSGKSTVAREVADRLGLDYLDTGAMYRAVAYSALRHDMDPSDDDAVAELTRRIEIDVTPDRVTVDGADATVEIRGPAVTRAVSTVAANPEVRAELVRRQREWAVDHDGGVIEGRDIGTVVFPNARLKVYLTARSDTRASRRAKEVTDLDYETVAADLARRDALDSSRQHDPLVQAVDAVIIETSELGVDAVVARVLDELDQ